jgi:hypothetical protein
LVINGKAEIASAIEPATDRSRLGIDPNREGTTDVPTTMKDMLTAARAAVPAITPTDAADLVTKSDALVIECVIASRSPPATR